MWFFIILAILFIAYLIFMQSTKELRERMYLLQQEEKNKPKRKPKPVKVYSRGYVISDIFSPYYKPDPGYSAFAGIDPEDKESFKMVVHDYNKRKDIGYIKDKRLYKTLEESPEHISFIEVFDAFKYSYDYDVETSDTLSISVKTFVNITNEESHKIQELSNKKVHKTKRKLNAYLREVGLFDESK